MRHCAPRVDETSVSERYVPLKITADLQLTHSAYPLQIRHAIPYCRGPTTYMNQAAMRCPAHTIPCGFKQEYVNDQCVLTALQMIDPSSSGERGGRGTHNRSRQHTLSPSVLVRIELLSILLWL